MPATKKTSSPDCLPELLKAALGRNARDCAVGMLGTLIKYCQASGAVLWQATEDAQPKASPPQGHLFMLATNFPGCGSFGIHNLDFVDTIAGRAVREGRPIPVNDISRDGGKHHAHPFLASNGLNKTIAFPFRFKDKTPGAVTVYRVRDAADFGAAEVAVLRDAFKFLPDLLAGAQVRARQELLEKAGEIFQASDAAGVADSDKSWHRNLQKLCDSIAALFHAAETSIILRDGPSADIFKARAVQTSDAHKKRIRTVGWTAREETSSFTEACLFSRRTIRIFDLRDCEREVETIRSKQLPRFQRRPWDHLEQDAREALGQPDSILDGSELPPLSFLVVPVVAGDKLHGVIRCWIAKPPVSYFSRQDQHLLELVAGQLARHCELKSREARFTAEVTAWRKISETLDKKEYYQSVGNRTLGRVPSLDDFAYGCFNLLDAVVKEADLNSFWLLNEQRNELSCAVAPMFHEAEGTTADTLSKWTAFVNQKIALAGDHPAAVVCRTGKERHFPDPDSLKQLPHKLPGLATQIIIPVGTSAKPLGVLELGSSSKNSFPDFAIHAVRLIAAFLGHHLATRKALSQHQKAERDRIEAQNFSNDAFQDIMHQMKGPLVEAARRIDEVARGLPSGSSLHQLAAKASQLVQRSARASRRVGILGQLSRSGKVTASRELLDSTQILMVLQDAWESARLRAHPRMLLRFTAAFQEIAAAIPARSMMDAELLMHAVHNVLDNAIKYSYRGQEVKLEAGSVQGGGWYLVIWNKGIPIKPQEARLARQRGWRSPMAQFTTGEGSGIGLWIVDRIMSALGGVLEVNPTRPDGWTYVRLQFNPVPLPPVDALRSTL